MNTTTAFPTKFNMPLELANTLCDLHRITKMSLALTKECKYTLTKLPENEYTPATCYYFSCKHYPTFVGVWFKIGTKEDDANKLFAKPELLEWINSKLPKKKIQVKVKENEDEEF